MGQTPQNAPQFLKVVPMTRRSPKATGKADDLTQMLSRASQNITLIYVKVPSTVLCLSYKVDRHLA